MVSLLIVPFLPCLLSLVFINSGCLLCLRRDILQHWKISRYLHDLIQCISSRATCLVEALEKDAVMSCLEWALIHHTCSLRKGGISPGPSAEREGQPEETDTERPHSLLTLQAVRIPQHAGLYGCLMGTAESCSIATEPAFSNNLNEFGSKCSPEPLDKIPGCQHPDSGLMSP